MITTSVQNLNVKQNYSGIGLVVVNPFRVLVVSRCLSAEVGQCFNHTGFARNLFHYNISYNF